MYCYQPGSDSFSGVSGDGSWASLVMTGLFKMEHVEDEYSLFSIMAVFGVLTVCLCVFSV